MCEEKKCNTAQSASQNPSTRCFPFPPKVSHKSLVVFRYVLTCLSTSQCACPGLGQYPTVNVISSLETTAGHRTLLMAVTVISSLHLCSVLGDETR